MDKLWSRSFILVGITNFLMFFSFYELLPVLPLYIFDKFHTGAGLAGLVISLYTIGALLCRPFAGFLVDTLARKPLYVCTYVFFTACFVGYAGASILLVLAIARLIHGVAFGIASTSGNTIAIDVLPSSRRGEGIGYFGVTTNLAFATGPMTGMFLYDSKGAMTVFTLSVAICIAGLFLLCFLRTASKPRKADARPISLDRFFLTNAVPQFLNMILIGCAYGPVTNYVALYAKEEGIGGAGFFYALIAVGLITSRVLTGRFIDRGYLTRLIGCGMTLLACAYFLFAIVQVPLAFFASAFFIGIGLGLVSPGYQTMCVNMARHDQRGTASSTYLSGWDTGIGLGILLGGPLAERFSYRAVFFSCALLLVIATLFFIKKTAPHYIAHRIED